MCVRPLLMEVPVDVTVVETMGEDGNAACAGGTEGEVAGKG